MVNRHHSSSILKVFGCLTVLPGAMPTTVRACDTLCEARDIVAALDSNDRVAQDLAKDRGLNHADRAIRGLALKKILGAMDVLSVQVDNFDGDAPAARFLPNLPALGFDRLQWNATGTSFGAWYGNRKDAVRGTLSGEALSAHYDQVIVGKDRADLITTCSFALRLTAQRDALEGPLRCRGVEHQFRVRLGL